MTEAVGGRSLLRKVGRVALGAQWVLSAGGGRIVGPAVCWRKRPAVGPETRAGPSRLTAHSPIVFFIDTDMVARIHRGGWHYVQRGVHHHPRTAGRSTIRPSDVPRTLLSTARMWLRLREAGSLCVTA